MARSKTPEIPLIIQGEDGRHSDTKRNELAAKLSQWINDARQGKSAWQTKAEENWSAIRNETMPTGVAQDQASVHWSLAQTRVDQLTALGSSVILSQEPPLVTGGSSVDADISEDQTRVMQRLCKEGGFYQAVSQSFMDGVVTNRSIIKLSKRYKYRGLNEPGFGATQSRFNGKIEWCGVLFDAIDSEDFIIAPDCPDIDDAVMVGNRFWQTVGAIKERQSVGDYLPFPTGNDGDDEDARLLGEGGDNGLSGDSFATAYEQGGVGTRLSNPDIINEAPEMQIIECWDLFCLISPAPGALRRRYRITYASEHNLVLKVEPWPLTRWPFVSSTMLREQVRGFWPERMIVRDLLPLQDQYDRDITQFFNGMQKSIEPTVISSGPLGEKNAYGVAGVVYEGEEDSMPMQVVPVPTQFSGEAVLRDMAGIERNADLVARTSANAQGTSDPKEGTATQANIIQESASIGINDLIKQFNIMLPQAGSIAMEMMGDARIWQVWSTLFGFADVPITTIQTASPWSVAGTSLAQSPMVQFGMIGQLLKASQDPRLGFDPYKLGRLLLDASQLQNARSVQMPLAEYQAQQARQQAAMQQQQQAAMQQPQPGPPGLPPPGGGDNLNGDAASNPSISDAVSRVAGSDGLTPTPQRGGPGQDMPPVAASRFRPVQNFLSGLLGRQG